MDSKPIVLKFPKQESVRILLKNQTGGEYVSLKDIIYIESESNYSNYHIFGRNKILSSHCLKSAESILNEYSFIRVHQSYLVNITHIKAYKKIKGGKKLIMSNNDEVWISRKSLIKLEEILSTKCAITAELAFY